MIVTHHHTAHLARAWRRFGDPIGKITGPPIPDNPHQPPRRPRRWAITILVALLVIAVGYVLWASLVSTLLAAAFTVAAQLAAGGA